MYKILWLEDYEDLTDALSILFEVRGYDIQVRQNSDCFLDAVSSYSPDIIILDLKLNGSQENGFDILRQLKSSEWAAIPVIIFSGYITTSYMKLSLDLGAIEYVLKPVRFAQLRGAVDRALGII